MLSVRRVGVRDRGATSLETVGMIGAAALVAGALMIFMVTNSPQIAQSVKYAVCTILGGQDCGSRPPLLDPHRPVEPCVVSTTNGSMNREVEIIFVTASDGRAWEVARLNDGTYRVTLVQSSSEGVEAGVGAGVTLTINDRTVGGSAVAEASASLQVRQGSTWYLPDAESVSRLMGEEAEDTIEDEVLGDGGPFRWVWERGQDAAGAITGNGDYEFPEADEVFAQGGVVLNASVEATAITDSGGAEVGITEALGVRTGRTGTTVYLRTKVEGKAGLQQIGIDPDGVQFEGTELEGSLELVTAVTFDSSGAMTQVSTTATTAGASSGAVNALFGGSSDPALSNQQSSAMVYQATLPIRSDGDRRTATNFLIATGVSQLGGFNLTTAVPTALATAAFVDAAQDRGYVTRQQFDTEDTTVFGFDAEGKLGIELGASAEVTSGSTRATDADYWNGVSWTEWAGCAA